MKGKIGGSTYVVSAVSLPDGKDARQRRQERYWAARDSAVTVTQLSELELAERKAASRARGASTSPDGLLKPWQRAARDRLREDELLALIFPEAENE